MCVRVCVQATEDSPEVIQNMFEDVRKNIKQCFDVEHMVVDSLTRDKDLVRACVCVCMRARVCVGGCMRMRLRACASHKTEPTL